MSLNDFRRSYVSKQIRWPYLVFIPYIMLFSEGSIVLRIIFVAVLLLVNFYYNLIPYYLTQYFHTRYAANFLEKYSDCEFLINNPRDFLSQEALDYDFNKRIGVTAP